MSHRESMLSWLLSKTARKEWDGQIGPAMMLTMSCHPLLPPHQERTPSPSRSKPAPSSDRSFFSITDTDCTRPSASASASTSASASGSESESASPTSSGVNTGGFDVENPGASGSPSPSATDSPNAASARQTAYVGYAGVAAAVMAFAAL